MEDKNNICEYCGEPTIETQNSYDREMQCYREIWVCENCANYLDNGGKL